MTARTSQTHPLQIAELEAPSVSLIGVAVRQEHIAWLYLPVRNVSVPDALRTAVAGPDEDLRGCAAG